mmetsp:Transcript_14844/g.29805  ORF Transcript_14844/g.29805 Transcript_14844/m.29805 type:complete len:96 (-) Transcript_14844:249-536(-)
MVHNFGGFSVLEQQRGGGAASEGTGSSSRPTVWTRVPLESIDSLGLPRLDLIKVDAQGMEEQEIRSQFAKMQYRIPPSLSVKYSRIIQTWWGLRR